MSGCCAKCGTTGGCDCYSIRAGQTIPIDYKVDGGGGPPPRQKYPFAGMSVGDSFFAPKSEYHRTTSAAYDYAKRHKVQFTTRSVEGGLRVWRVA